MPHDTELAERIRHVLRERSDLTERKMFGGLAFLLAGRMCCGILGGELIVRIADDEFQSVMRRPHVRLMDFTGKPLKGFVYVSPPGFRTSTLLRAWLARGERFLRQNSMTVAGRRAGTTRRPASRAR